MDHATLSAVFGRSSRLYSEAEVETALDKMALAISEQLSEKDPILLCVMNGGLITTGKLATRLNFPLQLDYLHASRYRGETSGSDLHWEKRHEVFRARAVLTKNSWIVGRFHWFFYLASN